MFIEKQNGKRETGSKSSASQGNGNNPLDEKYEYGTHIHKLVLIDTRLQKKMANKIIMTTVPPTTDVGVSFNYGHQL